MSYAAYLLRSWVRIPPGAWIFVCCECRVLSVRGLCDELITRPEESYRLCCVVGCDLETSRMGAPYIYDISRLRVNVSWLLHLLTEESSLFGCDAISLCVWKAPCFPVRLLFFGRFNLKMETLQFFESSGNIQRQNLTFRQSWIFSNAAVRFSNVAWYLGFVVPCIFSHSNKTPN